MNMVLNDTPHSVNLRSESAREAAHNGRKPKPKKPKPLPMPVKVDNLIAELRREGSTLLRTKKAYSVSTTGRAVSSAVAKVAIADERIAVVTGPLFDDGRAPALEWGPRGG